MTLKGKLPSTLISFLLGEYNALWPEVTLALTVNSHAEHLYQSHERFCCHFEHSWKSVCILLVAAGSFKSFIWWQKEIPETKPYSVGNLPASSQGTSTSTEVQDSDIIAHVVLCYMQYHTTYAVYAVQANSDPLSFQAPPEVLLTRTFQINTSSHCNGLCRAPCGFRSESAHTSVTELNCQTLG